MTNPMDVINKAAKKTGNGKKSKSSVPTIEVTSKKVNTLLKRWKDVKQKETDAVTARKTIEDALRPVGMKERREYIQGQKEHVTSIKLKGEKATIMLKTNKKYSEIPTESEDELRLAFGGKQKEAPVLDDEGEPVLDEDGEPEMETKIEGGHYDRLFSIHTSISFRDQFATDPKVLKAVIDAVGVERFGEIFDVKQLIKPGDVLIHERDLNKEVATMHDKAMEKGLLTPNKASFQNV